MKRQKSLQVLRQLIYFTFINVHFHKKIEIPKPYLYNIKKLILCTDINIIISDMFSNYLKNT